MILRGMLIPGVLVLQLVSTTASAGEIHQAVAQGDTARVAALLRGHPELASERASNGSQDCPLHVAAAAGRVDAARLLLDAGAEVDCPDRDGSTPLHTAAVSRQRAMVEFLLSRGADVHRRDANQSYALSFAASGGDSAVVQTILDAGADLDYTSPATGNTLMHLACTRGLWKLADLLLSRGVDINAGNRRGETPLHLVCRGRFPQRIEPTLARGADPARADSIGETPLTTACWYGKPEAVRVLLSHGADAGVVDRQGWTPIFGAAMSRCAECVRQLLERGASIRAGNMAAGSPLRWATDQGAGEVAALLLEAGARPDDVDSTFGWTLLHTAAVFGYQDIARALLDHGADPNARDAQGRTPLQLAERQGQTQLAAMLKARGAVRGAGKARGGRGLAGVSKPGPREAEVWYLGHSAWAVKTARHFLVFDYGDVGRRADQPGLRSGDINPAEIARERVTVFVSHEHADHFRPAIFEWRRTVPRIGYVLGFQPGNLPGNPAYECLEPRQSRTIDGMKVTTLRSNDSGVGFAIEVDGLSIFHPGDHTRRSMDRSDPFEEEIDVLVRQGFRPDIAFIPLNGCGMTDQAPVRVGTEYVLDTLKPRVLFPMHGGTCGNRYVEFIRSIRDRYPRTVMLGALCKGEHFHYRGGRAS
jgi:ankyrin repeat protein/L-ascorbate metabolism protein UlaG (beta-lactamase superfamily)